MPRGVKKENLPSKVCVVCDRTFNWRRKWEKVWEDVTTCSKSCNRKRRELKQKENRMQRVEETSIGSLYAEGENYSLSMLSTNELALAELLESVNLDEAMLLQGNNDHSENLDSHQQEAEISDECYDISSNEDYVRDPKAARKAAKKRMKAKRRAKREGRANSSVGQKPCDICGKSVDLAIRCRIDETLQWKMVCGKCWHVVSGGVIDGDSQHPHYQYGGLWKNRAKR